MPTSVEIEVCSVVVDVNLCYERLQVAIYGDKQLVRVFSEIFVSLYSSRSLVLSVKEVMRAPAANIIAMDL